MTEFIFYTPTKIFFGKGQIKVLSEQVKNYSDKILLVYGKASIKNSGIYDKIIKLLTNNNIEYYELNEVDPNPRLSSVIKGAEICRINKINFILAVGGGSVIDCAKAISFASCTDNDPWDFWKGKYEIKDALPIGVILTNAATGSEMNPSTVITNENTIEKLGKSSPLLLPKFSILDPEYTYTVSREQTASGVADIMTHVYEFYFSNVEGAFLQNRLSEAILKTCVHYSHLALNKPDNYEARSNLMWASSMALNGIISKGKIFDGTLHNIEHSISAINDVTHGAGLSAITYHWMKYILDDDNKAKFAEFARNVWEVNEKDDYKASLKGIEKNREFLISLNLPVTLKEIGINKDDINLIAEKSFTGDTLGRFKKLTKQDVINILINAL